MLCSALSIIQVEKRTFRCPGSCYCVSDIEVGLMSEPDPNIIILGKT